MSKKNKKWYKKGSWAMEEKQTQDLFGNTIAQHQKKIDKIAGETEYLVEDDYYVEDEFEYGYSSYNWNLDRKLSESKEDKEKDSKKNYDYFNPHNSWRGYSYYEKPQLSYKYIQQMANALSAEHNVKIRVGNEWKVDLLKKELTYNPASLVYGTKGELLATLLHEIGKLRYCEHPDNLGNRYITMYKIPAKETMNVFEDIRVDYQVLKTYESAGEVYDSAIPSIEKQVENYTKMGEIFKEAVAKYTAIGYDEIAQKYSNSGSTRVFPKADAFSTISFISADDSNVGFQNELKTAFGISDPEEVRERIYKIKKDYESRGTIFDYCASMIYRMYDLDSQLNELEDIKKRAEASFDSIEPIKKKETSREVADILDANIFPIVEDLFRDFTDQNSILERLFPDMNDGVAKNILDYSAKEAMGSAESSYGNKGNDKNPNPRMSGRSDSTIPPEWTTGDYKTLKDSVAQEIKQLVNRLTFIRREELVDRFESNQKRGKLNAKKLYKSATGSKRLFKKKLPNTDTVQSFAFSLCMDVSGSMRGDRIVHTTRAAIILGEVFKKMNIPFEFVVFSTGAKFIKAFDQTLDKKIETKIGGLAKHGDGGTNLDQGLEVLKIHSRPEKNKVVIVLTDGGVGTPEYFDTQYFIPWQKKNVKSVGFGIECEPQMAQLCMGNSKSLDNAADLPVEFSNLLKSLIKRK